jgi:hypothetical protein
MLLNINSENEFEILHTTFKSHFGWHRSRITLLVSLITAIIKVQTVRFERLAEAMDSDAQVLSRLRRIQRFFALFKIEIDLVSKFLFANLPKKTDLSISMDRTNWKFGNKDINIFMLSVNYLGMAFPLLWQMLDKQGNSNCKERITLIDRFIKLFGKDCIKELLADREFIGDKWFKYLETSRIPSHIRIKSNLWLKKHDGKSIKVGWLAQSLKVGEVYHHPTLVYLGNSLVYITIKRLEKGEYLVIASYNNQGQSVDCYKKRWQIETMFKAFKTNAYNMEDTHLKDDERINKLLVIISIAFFWAYKAGVQKDETKPIKIKKHGRKAYSFFKYGLSALRDLLLNGKSREKSQLKSFLKILSCT